MYATINIPGSSHFEYFGPSTKKACESWLAKRVIELSRTQLMTSLLPQRLVSNKEAEAWKYRDGSKVCRPHLSQSDLEEVLGQPSLPCGCDGPKHESSCPGFNFTDTGL